MLRNIILTIPGAYNSLIVSLLGVMQMESGISPHSHPYCFL